MSLEVAEALISLEKKRLEIEKVLKKSHSVEERSLCKTLLTALKESEKNIMKGFSNG